MTMPGRHNLSGSAAFEEPDLNVESYDRVLAREQRRMKLSPGSARSEPMRRKFRESARRIVKGGRQRPRVRARWSNLVGTRRRGDGTHVAYRPGVVELANQPGWDYDFRIAFRPTTSGGLETHAVAVIARDGGPAVTTTGVRAANIGSAVQVALRHLMMAEPGTADVSGSDVRIALDQSEGPAHRRRVTTNDLEKTAELYVEAQSKGVPTTSHVQQGLKVSADTARKRVRQARVGGLLPPSNNATRPKP